MKKKGRISILAILIILFMNVNISYAISGSSNVRYQGIDVSDWQGYIDYSEVKAQGIDIVYIKSSQGKEKHKRINTAAIATPPIPAPNTLKIASM